LVARLVILNEFSLYHDESMRQLHDLKILLRLSKSDAKRRREVSVAILLWRSIVVIRNRYVDLVDMALPGS
jgi:hypothetical protein